MASILPGFEYYIFISHRHNDNHSVQGLCSLRQGLTKI